MTPLDWLKLALVYPLLEEWVFRAGLLRWVDARWPVPPGAHACFGRLGAKHWRHNAAVSLLFSLAHLWSWAPLHAALVFWPSLLLGWVWQRWRRLWPCVVLHAGMNLLGFHLLPAV